MIISQTATTATVEAGKEIMEDDYTEVDYPDSEVEFGVDNFAIVDVDDTNAISTLLDLSNFNLNDVAQSIRDDSVDATISADELKLIMESSVNSRVYEKSRNGVEKRFFDTIFKFGSESMKQLALYCDDGFMKERVFYVTLRGERSEVKRFILNKCLVKIALKWRNNKKNSKDYGKQLQPSTWNKMLKYLFSIFRKKT